jgi:hypothetical protein
MITSIIVHYKRSENIAEIVDGIRKQSIPSKIWIWDNSGECPNLGDVMIKSNHNFAQLGRWMLLQAVQTKYVWLNDDDGKIRDPKLFENLIVESARYPETALGWKGKVFKDAHPEKPYQNTAGWVQYGQESDMINMGFSFFPRVLINKIISNPFDVLTEKEHRHGDEIYISSRINTRSSAHIFHSVDMISECGLKLSGKSDHMSIRNTLCKRYWL